MTQIIPITEDSYPCVYRVVRVMHAELNLPVPEAYGYKILGPSECMPAYGNNIDALEHTLSSLTSEEIETLAGSDEAEWDPIYQKIEAARGEDARYCTHLILDDMFTQIGDQP